MVPESLKNIGESLSLW